MHRAYGERPPHDRSGKTSRFSGQEALAGTGPHPPHSATLPARPALPAGHPVPEHPGVRHLKVLACREMAHRGTGWNATTGRQSIGARPGTVGGLCRLGSTTRPSRRKLGVEPSRSNGTSPQRHRTEADSVSDRSVNGCADQESEVVLSVVVPAYNEERRLEPSLKAICQYLDERDRPWELIIVNDGSSDRTAEVIAAAARADPRIRMLQSATNHGKGHAVRLGGLAAWGG